LEFTPENYDKVVRLMEKGVEIPNPLSLDLGDAIDIDRISGNGVRIYPGCRIYGRETVIAAGAQIGREGPVTIENHVKLRSLSTYQAMVELEVSGEEKLVFYNEETGVISAAYRTGAGATSVVELHKTG